MATGVPIDRRRVARSLSTVENRRPEADELLRRAHARDADVPVIGLTGPMGAGKSTLLDHLALQWAEAGERVAVIAIDPSSPYTGGAVLGDRVRMMRAAAHPGVFLRSMASRGQPGGLSRAAHDVVAACCVLGFDRVLIETVGSGQSDVDVADLADAVVVVAVPGLGDQVQAGKAGILEIGDVFAVNKADLPGAQAAAAQLLANLDLVYVGRAGRNDADVASAAMPAANAALRARHGGAQDQAFWRPPVLRVSAATGDGVVDLARACDAFLAWQREGGHHRRDRAQRLRRHLLRLAVARLMRAAADDGASAAIDAGVRAMREGRATPEQAAALLLQALCLDAQPPHPPAEAGGGDGIGNPSGV